MQQWGMNGALKPHRHPHCMPHVSSILQSFASSALSFLSFARLLAGDQAARHLSNYNWASARCPRKTTFILYDFDELIYQINNIWYNF